MVEKQRIEKGDDLGMVYGFYIILWHWVHHKFGHRDQLLFFSTRLAALGGFSFKMATSWMGVA
jgi:hypothetical protein